MRWPFLSLPRKRHASLLLGALSLLGAPGLRPPRRLDGGGDRAAAPATFDIRDGASLLRIPTSEILAARAAGNYVEFLIADARR